MTLLAVGYHYVAAEPPAEPHAIFPVTVDVLAARRRDCELTLHRPSSELLELLVFAGLDGFLR